MAVAMKNAATHIIFFKEKITTFACFDGIGYHKGVLWTVNDWFTAGLC
jgi:hypothetical protein